MYFGSVRFFRHLILTVLALLIIVPTILCIVFFCDNCAKADEIERLNSVIAGYNDSSDSSATESTDDISSVPSVTEDNTSSENLPVPPAETEATPPENTSQPEQSQTTSETTTSTAASETTVQTTTATTSESSAPAEESSVPEAIPDTDLTVLYPDMYADSYTGEYTNDDNTVYLTFDDGPSILTENILYYLKQEGIKATFFVTPQETYGSANLLRRIAQEGHTIGIHTYSHDYEAIYASPEAFLDDFYKAYSLVYEATGIKCDIFRFAGGSINDYNTDTYEAITEEMERRGFVYFDWNVDSNDWQGLSWTELYNNITTDACELLTPVILMHDTGDRENTVLVLEDIIKALKNKGYSFGSLSQKTQPVQFQ